MLENKVEVNQEIPVVNILEAKNEAHNLGQQHLGNAAPGSLSYFKESAKWCNTLSSKIKALVGCNGKNHHVVIVETADDLPMDGEVVECTYVYNKLVDAFDRGATGEPLYD